MVFLGFGKYVRADRIFAVEPLPADERGSGARTRVWVEGIPDAVIASRSEPAPLNRYNWHEICWRKRPTS